MRSLILWGMRDFVRVHSIHARNEQTKQNKTTQTNKHTHTYTCVYIYIYIYTYTHTHPHSCIRKVSISTYRPTYSPICLSIYPSICLSICKYRCMCVYVYIYIYIYIYMFIYVCACACPVRVVFCLPHFQVSHRLSHSIGSSC